MKSIIYIFLFPCFLFSCEPKLEEENSTYQVEKEVDSTEDYWVTNHCLTGKPIKTLDTTLLQSYEFTLEKTRGLEKAEYSNGDRLVVSNEGCEVFWISYTFFINNYDQNASNVELVEYAFSQVEKVDVAPIDFDKALQLIRKIKEEGGSIKLGNEYFLKMDAVSEMFEIDEIDLKKEYATVEFSFAIGKL